MKITTLIAALSVLSLCSCKKDYNCECTNTTLYPSGNSITGATQTITYTKIKKSEAKSICETSTIETENASGAITITTNNCKLK